MQSARAPQPGSPCCSGYQLCATPEATGVARLLALPSRSSDQHDDRAMAVPQSQTQPPWRHFAGSKPSTHNAEEAPPAPPPRCVADERDERGAVPARRPTPEPRYGHHPVGPDSPVRVCASLCARRLCEEQPCACVIRRRRQAAAPSSAAANAPKREQRPSGASGRRRSSASGSPAAASRRQRQKAAAGVRSRRESRRRLRRRRGVGDGARPSSSGSEVAVPTEAIGRGRDDTSVLHE